MLACKSSSLTTAISETAAGYELTAALLDRVGDEILLLD